MTVRWALGNTLGNQPNSSGPLFPRFTSSSSVGERTKSISWFDDYQKHL
jgi:hypothetical protein